MGIYFGATICTGVFVYEAGGELNSSFVDKMFEECDMRGEDFYMIEFLDDLFDKSEYDIVLGGADEDEQTALVVLPDTVIETEWSPINITGAGLNVTADMEEKLEDIKAILKKNDLDYGDSGTFLVPYYYT